MNRLAHGLGTARDSTEVTSVVVEAALFSVEDGQKYSLVLTPWAGGVQLDRSEEVLGRLWSQLATRPGAGVTSAEDVPLLFEIVDPTRDVDALPPQMMSVPPAAVANMRTEYHTWFVYWDRRELPEPLITYETKRVNFRGVPAPGSTILEQWTFQKLRQWVGTGEWDTGEAFLYVATTLNLESLHPQLLTKTFWRALSYLGYGAFARVRLDEEPTNLRPATLAALVDVLEEQMDGVPGVASREEFQHVTGLAVAPFTLRTLDRVSTISARAYNKAYEWINTVGALSRRTRLTNPFLCGELYPEVFAGPEPHAICGCCGLGQGWHGVHESHDPVGDWWVNLAHPETSDDDLRTTAARAQGFWSSLLSDALGIRFVPAPIVVVNHTERPLRLALTEIRALLEENGPQGPEHLRSLVAVNNRINEATPSRPGTSRPPTGWALVRARQSTRLELMVALYRKVRERMRGFFEARLAVADKTVERTRCCVCLACLRCPPTLPEVIRESVRLTAVPYVKDKQDRRRLIKCQHCGKHLHANCLHAIVCSKVLGHAEDARIKPRRVLALQDDVVRPFLACPLCREDFTKDKHGETIVPPS